MSKPKLKQQKEIRIGVPDPNQELTIIDEFNNPEFRVAIFGSARTEPDTQVFKDVFELSRMIADDGFDLINGGGPGVMQAASEGHNAGANLGKDVHTIGLNIELPFEQEANKYLDLVETHKTFSTRLDQFMLLSNVIVVAPGGIGTCLELFYTLQLMQVDHICKMPVILYGKMWEDLLSWVKNGLLKGGYISKEDLYPMVVVETPEQAMSVIRLAHENYEKDGKDACMNIKKYAAACKQMGVDLVG